MKRGAVYAELGQTGDDRKDFYNNGYQRGTSVDPKRPLTIHITGDNPVGDQTSGSFWLEYEGGNHSEKTPFTLLMPAFVTSELKTAFQIGFLIFIPFVIAIAQELGSRNIRCNAIAPDP